VALFFVVMVSALWRMYLYYEAFGLTELRLYTTAFMLWLGAVLSVFLVTALRNRRALFGSWTLATGFAAIVLLNAVNPDALIARVNIERMEAGERFDPHYLAYLSADAAPVIVERLPEFGKKRIEPDYTLEQALLDRWKKGSGDWRTWNLSRAKAQSLAETYRASPRLDLTEDEQNTG
jgi:hypothetical protein